MILDRVGFTPISALALLSFAACTRHHVVAFETSETAVTIHEPGLYPETIEYDPSRDEFLVSSLRRGGIYRVEQGGTVAQLVSDERLCSVLGIAVDVAHNRLWATNSDLGASARASREGPKNLAAVAACDLVSGKVLHYVDLANLTPAPHLMNGVAIDALGNAYVTDSFSPTIYRIDTAFRASVFLSDPAFNGPGINLNGVVAHPDGYLLVVKKSDGALFKVPLDNPAGFSRVAVPQGFAGGDGLLLLNKRDLVIIANQVPGSASNAAFWVTSNDGFASAQVGSVRKLGDVYPTTAAQKNGTIHVLYSQLNELLTAPPEQKAQKLREATIQPIGRVDP